MNTEPEEKIMTAHWTGSSHISASHSVNAQEWQLHKNGVPNPLARVSDAKHAKGKSAIDLNGLCVIE